MNKETIAAVYFASPSLWRRFYSVFSELKLAKVPTFYCLGETTRQVLDKTVMTLSSNSALNSLRIDKEFSAFSCSKQTD
ncbi:hypothetical protein GQR36_22045 [Enterococcus termitis]